MSDAEAEYVLQFIRDEEGVQMLDLVGAWRLASSYFVAQESGDRLDLFGAKPLGYAVFDPRGRMVVLMTSADRAPAQSSSDMATLFKTMVAYTGRWLIDGEKFVTKVDGAWDPSWVGTEQVRYYTFDGQTLSSDGTYRASVISRRQSRRLCRVAT